MRKATGILLAIIFLLFGVILGFIVAPVKKGITISNNGNNNGSNNKDNNGYVNQKKPSVKPFSESDSFKRIKLK